MQIIKLNHLKSHAFDHFEPPLTATALGNFDGVHLGHQEVIREAVRIARSKNWQAGVMTFHPHPREVLAGKQNGGYLTPIEERYQYFEALGVDIVYIIQFNHAIAQMLPEEFIHAYIEGLHIKHVVTGFDFTFGHKGSGDTNLLAEWAREVQSFQYTKVLPVTFNGEKISTTRIKALLEAGDVATAGNLLGKPYTVTGKVVHGAKQGRLLGFPTPMQSGSSCSMK